MIRVAAVGDIHYDSNTRDHLGPQFRGLGEHADLLLIAGDLTQSGTADEAKALAEDLRACPIPVVAVLGNHDYHSGQEAKIRSILEAVSVNVLEGAACCFDVRGHRVGVAGLKGFGGGFFGACCTEFGEAEMKQFARHAKDQAEILKKTLEDIRDVPYRFVLLHFSPVEETLLGERREIYPFLGSYLLAEAIDSVGADGVFHGHAHKGSERGVTPGGVPVRNVALHVIRHAYHVYTFEKGERGVTFQTSEVERTS